jgi:hypothetical protein
VKESYKQAVKTAPALKKFGLLNLLAARKSPEPSMHIHGMYLKMLDCAPHGKYHTLKFYGFIQNS